MTLTNLTHPKHPAPVLHYSQMDNAWILPGKQFIKSKAKAKALMTRYCLNAGYKLKESA